MEVSASQPQADKRKHLRVSLVVRRVTANDRVRTFFGYADDISKSGMFIHTENPREPGSQFEVELSLPRPVAQNVRVHCEVVWRRLHTPASSCKPGMGLRFLDMPLDVAGAIDRWAREG
ncbi:MAG: PilZ domain-containing protein [Pseudomonadota bacterium]